MIHTTMFFLTFKYCFDFFRYGYIPVIFLFKGPCSSHIYLHYYYYYYNYFQSPGYPNCYPDNRDCTWLIEAPAGYYVLLEVYQFNLEYGGSNCPYDYLEIYDGHTSSSHLITRACGSLSYFRIYSSGRFLLVQFHSNGVTRMTGFYAYCHATSGSKRNTLVLFNFKPLVPY